MIDQNEKSQVQPLPENVKNFGKTQGEAFSQKRVLEESGSKEENESEISPEKVADNTLNTNNSAEELEQKEVSVVGPEVEEENEQIKALPMQKVVEE